MAKFYQMLAGNCVIRSNTLTHSVAAVMLFLDGKLLEYSSTPSRSITSKIHCSCYYINPAKFIAMVMFDPQIALYHDSHIMFIMEAAFSYSCYWSTQNSFRHPVNLIAQPSPTKMS